MILQAQLTSFFYSNSCQLKQIVRRFKHITFIVSKVRLCKDTKHINIICYEFISLSFNEKCLIYLIFSFRISPIHCKFPSKFNCKIEFVTIHYYSTTLFMKAMLFSSKLSIWNFVIECCFYVGNHNGYKKKRANLIFISKFQYRVEHRANTIYR